jgi:metallo-beta-lactamase superfamily protein
MTARRFVLTMLLALIAGSVSIPAQTDDARSLLQAAAMNMGTGSLRTLQYTASGMIAAPGQAFDPIDRAIGVPEHWPRFAVSEYTMTIDFGTTSSREEYTRTAPTYAKQFPGLDGGGGEHGNQSDPGGLRGGGFINDPAPRRIHQVVSGNVAWDVTGANAVRQWSYLSGIDAAEYRQLEIAMNPHGFIKAALASGANPTMVPGRSNQVMITVLGKYKVIGTVQQNLLTDTLSWIPNPVAGDIRITHSYTRWKDFGGVKFYTDNHSHMTVNGDQDPLQYRILDVKANVALPPNAFAVPAAVQQATRPVERVESQKLADAVWLLGGGSHNSVLVAFRDFVAVIEAPLNDERSQAVIAEVKRLVPGKPIRYVVNTHHHWDHSGGLRGFVAEGATIVTHEENIPYYRSVMFGGKFTLQPDRLAKLEEATRMPVQPQFLGVTNRYLLTDHVWGTDAAPRMMEIYNTAGGSPAFTSHDEWLLAVYLPAEKLLINADLYSPPAQGAQPPATAPEGVVALGELIRQNRLNVAQHVPVHGRPGTQEEFARILGGRVPPNSHGPLILPTTTSSSQ